MLKFLAQAALAFLIWTFAAYFLHRLCHIHSRWNPLWFMHSAHHGNNYIAGKPSWPKWHEYFFWFGTVRKTADVWIVFVSPLLLVASAIGGGAWALLPIYYLYEVFLADTVLEHNPRLRGRITKFFSIGQYHLWHHHKFKVNYSFFIPLWDHLFRTFESSPSQDEGKL